MFTLRRRTPRKHAELFREELGEGLGHLAQAANHAAGGLGTAVGPAVSAARTRMAPTAERVRAAAVAGIGGTAAVLAPIAATATQAARDSAKVAGRKGTKVRKQAARVTQRPVKGRSRTGRILALAAAGAVVGGIAAMIVRRQQQQRAWDDFDAERDLGPDTDGLHAPDRVGAGVSGSGVLTGENKSVGAHAGSGQSGSGGLHSVAGTGGPGGGTPATGSGQGGTTRAGEPGRGIGQGGPTGPAGRGPGGGPGRGGPAGGNGLATGRAPGAGADYGMPTGGVTPPVGGIGGGRADGLAAGEGASGSRPRHGLRRGTTR
ncbi:hypothetical protein GCM10010124_26750 [Pilimelia terevasa]|uniref:Uncharacterized protein n=1 Tax=Pilimelia terevasa TaxID=53372 RepID=A0A8J3BV55_9ACTN|nr:hypothetical protein [Pilimelia terevasa]GGK32638.1 hypothetical protein GCM10010124_26750 [Pilimelia terevasa]